MDAVDNNMIDEIKSEIGASNKKVRVAINGFGRIGRMIFRAGFNDPNIEFVVINDLSSAESLRYFLQYDTTQGKFPLTVSVEDNCLVVGDKRIPIVSERDINKLPWKDYSVDIVAECTGLFTDAESAKVHIKNGAKKVLISAPGKGDGVFFLVRGVNDHDYNGEDIVSNGSCTTNSMTAIVNEIHKRYGIKKGMFATVHSVTGDQRILDANHKKLRRGRAGPFNIVPTTTGAAKSVIKLIPELEGKLHGIAYRVPTPTGSITDLNLVLEKSVTREEINQFLKDLSENELNGIIEFSEEEIVSTDIIGNTHSGIVDSLCTEVVDGNLVKLAIWYDNEYGFSCRMIEVIKIMSNFIE